VEPAKVEARRKFDSWAARYERDRRSRLNARPQQEALAMLALLPGDRFLDVGCGTGAAVRLAARVVERAVGVDLSPRMIGRAKELADGSEPTEFVVGDSERLPFPSGAFTAVLCTAAFHHYPNACRALDEMARVLSPEGRLVLGDGTADRRAARVCDWLMRRLDGSHVRLYRTDELLALLGEAGFGEVAVRHLWDGGYAIVLARRASQARRASDA
jgi:ubiquinone/menaquinone biosynthesis C-methylase UbiE